MNYLFASDFHGDYDTLNKLLMYATRQDKQDNTQLILLGDYLDGYTSNHAIAMTANILGIRYDFRPTALTDNVHLIRGNHDQFILGTINHNYLDYATWLQNGGIETLKALGAEGWLAGHIGDYDPTLPLEQNTIIDEQLGMNTVAEFLKYEYTDFINFLEASQPDWEDDNFYATHGGVDLDLVDPRDTSADDKQWLRDYYYFEDDQKTPRRNTLDKIIITGHTPVQSFKGHEDSAEPIILKQDVNDTPRYVIDGGSNSGTKTGQPNIVTFTTTETGVKYTGTIAGKDFNPYQ